MATPTITFSTEENGEAIDTLNLGEGGYNGQNPDQVSLWIRHDGSQPITNVRLYIAPYSGTYIGTDDAQLDYDITLDGGDHYTDGFGGSLEGSPYFGWLKISTDGGATFTVVSSADATGNSLQQPINLGTIAANTSKRVILQHLFFSEISDSIPLGLRQLDLRLTYTFTD